MYTKSEGLTKFSQDFHEIVCLKQLRYFLFNRSFSAQRANHMCLFWLSSTECVQVSFLCHSVRAKVACIMWMNQYQVSKQFYVKCSKDSLQG